MKNGICRTEDEGKKTKKDEGRKEEEGRKEKERRKEGRRPGGGGGGGSPPPISKGGICRKDDKEYEGRKIRHIKEEI